MICKRRCEEKSSLLNSSKNHVKKYKSKRADIKESEEVSSSGASSA